MNHRIGLVYVPGVLPCFEDFGNLPTDLVKGDGIVDGEPASDILDMLIIPGGSLVESQSITPRLKDEILEIADNGKFILGICSVFQILAKETNTGRSSPIPLIKPGLGLLDVTFEPLICTDRVEATVTGESFITHNLRGEKVTGFHCHTYGRIILGKNAQPFLLSHVQKVDYLFNHQDLISGVTNRKGNVVGIMPHALLDENFKIVKSILNSLEISYDEFKEIKALNDRLKRRMKSELGISTGAKVHRKENLVKPTSVLLIASTATGAGKTFITAGIAGALNRRGLRVEVLKVGSDVRDVVPALYLIKQPMKKYSSIKTGKRGWMPVDLALKNACENGDIVLIEGVMGALTGLIDEPIDYPLSTVEIALRIQAPIILIFNCEPHGLEDAVIDAIAHISLLRKLGIDLIGVIFNRVSPKRATASRVKELFEKRGIGNVSVLGFVPQIMPESRGVIPEVEIKYEEFTTGALNAVEKYVDLDAVVNLSRSPKEAKVNHAEIIQRAENWFENFVQSLLDV